MSEESQAPAPDTTTDPRLVDYEEPGDAAVRRRLRLRPIVYAGFASHPDRRPCPPWCASAGDGYGHVVEPDHPFAAYHEMEERPAIAASFYKGARDNTDDDIVAASTVELALSQIGRARPVIRAYFRHAAGRSELLVSLTLQDARELARILEYVVDVADPTGVTALPPIDESAEVE
jgi:hypothetical protein